MRKNTVNLSGYINNVKDVSDKLTVASLAVSSKDKEGNWKSVYFDINTKPGTVEDGKLYDVSGFMKGDVWEDKQTGKKKTKPVIVVQEVTHIDSKRPEGENSPNKIEISGFVNNVKNISDNLVVFSIAASTKMQDDTYETYWIEAKTNPNKVSIEEKKLFQFSGFVVGDFWEDKESGKLRSKPVLWITEAEHIEKS